MIRISFFLKSPHLLPARQDDLVPLVDGRRALDLVHLQGVGL